VTDKRGVAPDRQYAIDQLLRIMERLRDPEFGCPWDRKQDFRSIAPYTLEECYELVDAIEQDNLPHLADELGDVLFQVVFYSQLGREIEAFDFNSVVDGIARKLLRRHPHVFADGEIEGYVAREISTDEVKAAWEAIKGEERASRAGAATRILDDIPRALPALPRAQKLQKRASNVGFDWQSVDGVMDKLDEELTEFKQALSDGAGDNIREELGDLMFSLVNVARHLGLDAESVLRQANSKFEKRFNTMEDSAARSGLSLDQESIEQLEARWAHAKTAD